MPTKFQCRCGKWLQAREELAGKNVRCPGCGRMLVVPQPKPAAPETEWQVDASPAAADAAQRAGVVGRGRASVVRLHAPDALERELPIRGEVTCRFCRNSIAFHGHVFGRLGLGGTLANVGCHMCKSRIWVGYATHACADGSDVFIYIPSLTRDFAIDEGGRELPAPPMTVQQPPWLYPATVTSDADADRLLKHFRRAVTKQETYEEVRTCAAALVTERLSPEQTERSRSALRKSLAGERHTHLMALLAEALACLRDEEAGPLVQAALRRALDSEDLADKSNAPLRDLCVLSLLFRDSSAFKTALERDLPRSAAETRACKLGKRLLFTEVIELVEDDEYLDSYESVFGGDGQLFIYPVRGQEAEPDTAGRTGFLSRLFGGRKKTGDETK